MVGDPIRVTTRPVDQSAAQDRAASGSLASRTRPAAAELAAPNKTLARRPGRRYCGYGPGPNLAFPCTLRQSSPKPRPVRVSVGAIQVGGLVDESGCHDLTFGATCSRSRSLG